MTLTSTCVLRGHWPLDKLAAEHGSLCNGLVCICFCCPCGARSQTSCVLIGENVFVCLCVYVFVCTNWRVCVYVCVCVKGKYSAPSRAYRSDVLVQLAIQQNDKDVLLHQQTAKPGKDVLGVAHYKGDGTARVIEPALLARRVVGKAARVLDVRIAGRDVHIATGAEDQWRSKQQ